MGEPYHVPYPCAAETVLKYGQYEQPSTNRRRTMGVAKMEQEGAPVKGAKRCAGAAQIGSVQTFSWDDK